MPRKLCVSVNDAKSSNGTVRETILAQQELSRVRTDYLDIVTDYNKAQSELLKPLGTRQRVFTQEALIKTLTAGA